MINRNTKEEELGKLYPPTAELSSSIRAEFEKSDCGISTQTLGKSIQGLPIDLYKIGSGPTNILYVGAHHGAAVNLLDAGVGGDGQTGQAGNDHDQSQSQGNKLLHIGTSFHKVFLVRKTNLRTILAPF